jgi:hypothetical protein
VNDPRLLQLTNRLDRIIELLKPKDVGNPEPFDRKAAFHRREDEPEKEPHMLKCCRCHGTNIKAKWSQDRLSKITATPYCEDCERKKNPNAFPDDPLPEKIVRQYVNIYKDRYSSLFDTREEADQAADKDRLYCSEITIPLRDPFPEKKAEPVSPLPWRNEGGSISNSKVVICDGRYDQSDIAGARQWEVNGDFIIEACNQHAALIKLRDVVGKCFNEGFSGEWNNLEAALKAAKETV